MNNLTNPKYQSSVNLERMYFKKIVFSRADNHFDSAELQIGFNREYKLSDDCCKASVSLSCVVHDPQKDILNLEINIVGNFSCNAPDYTDRETLLTKNTIAILFPYLRSQVSLVTTQPDMTPIVIPPINIESIFEDCP